jgi:phenylacetate-CoA ligase
MLIPKSSVPGIVWPAVMNLDASGIVAVLFQLEQSQWWSPEQLQTWQFKQLDLLVHHAWGYVPFYRSRLAAAGLEPSRMLSPDAFARLPLLTRADIQQAEKNLCARQLPPGHGHIFNKSTSGSTGKPILAFNTGVGHLFWKALTLRDHLWYQRDFNGKLAAIRYCEPEVGRPPHGSIGANWGPATEGVCETGPAMMLNITSTVSQQVDWLLRQKADYLIAYPSNLIAIAQYCIEHNIELPSFQQIRTFGELLGEEVRPMCREIWNAPVVDMYSSQEVGYIALQCPHYEHYHIQSECVLVEVLNDENLPCAPGEIGRIVITTLHNYVMPLLRYEIGDYAEVGEPCECGRGLPVIKRIWGRKRNMLVLPSGEKRWPILRGDVYRDIAPIRQFQFVQTSLTHINVRLVVEEPITVEQENALKALIHSRLGDEFELTLTYHEEIPRSAGGKFEDFVSAIQT